MTLLLTSEEDGVYGECFLGGIPILDDLEGHKVYYIVCIARQRHKPRIKTPSFTWTDHVQKIQDYWLSHQSDFRT